MVEPTGESEMKGFNKICVVLVGFVLSSCVSANPNPPSGVASTPVNDGNAYSLDWKIDANAPVGYKTAMNPAEGSDTTITFNFGTPIPGNDIFNALSQQFSNLKLPQTTSLISILKLNPQGNISVKMILDQVNLPDASSSDTLGQMLSQQMQSMVGTVQLRGELTPDGEISSFYLDQNQRNLLAIFFELPTGMVHVGDTWSLDFHCISMGAGYIGDTSQKINKVKFSGLSQTPDGKPIAILDYVMAESVNGSFQAGFTNNSTPTPTSMTCSFVGRGEFLIEQGHWQQLIGDFSIKATGIMQSDATQHFALMPLEEIPQQYVGLE